jgi:large subunit ribosomal protein L25
MDEVVLNASPRSVVGKQVRALRRAGKVPATIYGATHETMNIELDARELARLLSHIVGETQLISLRIGGDGQAVPVLAREIQRNPIRGDVVHVDFYAVAMDRPIRTEIPLRLVGHAAPVERREAVLIHPLTHLEIECLPRDLAPGIDVDISRLETFDDAIHVRDIVPPPGMTVLTDAEELVARLSPVAPEEEAEEVAPAAEAEPEIIGKGKAAEEEAEEGEEE